MSDIYTFKRKYLLANLYYRSKSVFFLIVFIIFSSYLLPLSKSVLKFVFGNF